MSSPVKRVEVLQALDLVAEERRPERGLGVGREDLERLAAHPERAAAERGVVARVLDRDELAQELVAVDEVALLEHLHVHVVRLGRAEAEDGRHARDDDDVAAGEDGGGRRVAQAVDLLVDRRVLLDVEVLARDVRLGLVVVVVGDEVLDRVVGEERPELVAELGGERLVVRHDERRALDALDDARHRHRLAGAGGAQEGHHPVPAGQRLRRPRRSPAAGRRRG